MFKLWELSLWIYASAELSCIQPQATGAGTSFVLTRREGAGFVLKCMFRTLYMLFYMFQYKCTHHGKLTCVLFYMFQYLYKCTHHGKLTCVRPCVTTDCAAFCCVFRIAVVTQLAPS